MARDFDVIVVGARIAGCATAYALARQGWHVALVERKVCPLGGTLSLPITQPRGLARFRDLGLLPVIEAIMPHLKPVRTYHLGLSERLTIAGACPAFAGFDFGVILRREVLDGALLDYVLKTFPGAITFFDGTNVDALLHDEQTGQVTGVAVHSVQQGELAKDLYAPLVIGADGRFSQVARLAGAKPYHTRHSSTTLYYSYCRGINMAGLSDIVFLPAAQRRMVVFSEVGDGLQIISAWFPVQQFVTFRQRPKDELQATWKSVPELEERTRGIQLLGKTMGLTPQSAYGYFRPAGGSGWALVGDARHYKDPASGQGLHDALYSVQQLLKAIEATTGGTPLTSRQALQRWPHSISAIQRTSDRALMPMYRFTYTFAEGLTHPPTMLEQALLRAIAKNPSITRRFLGIMSGATDVTAFNRAAPLYMLRGLLPAQRPQQSAFQQ